MIEVGIGFIAGAVSALVVAGFFATSVQSRLLGRVIERRQFVYEGRLYNVRMSLANYATVQALYGDQDDD